MCDKGVTRDIAIAQASSLANASTSVLASIVGDYTAELSAPLAEDVDLEVMQPSLDSALHVADTPVFEPGSYVVSIQRSGFRRLHQIGKCPRQPGRDYAAFELLGTSEPDTAHFHQRCKHCFKMSS